MRTSFLEELFALGSDKYKIGLLNAASSSCTSPGPTPRARTWQHEPRTRTLADATQNCVEYTPHFTVA